MMRPEWAAHKSIGRRLLVYSALVPLLEAAICEPRRRRRFIQRRAQPCAVGPTKVFLRYCTAQRAKTSSSIPCVRLANSDGIAIRRTLGPLGRTPQDMENKWVAADVPGRALRWMICWAFGPNDFPPFCAEQSCRVSSAGQRCKFHRWRAGQGRISAAGSSRSEGRQFFNTDNVDERHMLQPIGNGVVRTRGKHGP